MAFNDFTVEDQGKAICFWQETNAKHKKYSKSLTWQEFKGKFYIKAENRAQLEGRFKRCIKKIQEDQPEIFQKLFSNLKYKIHDDRIYGLQNIHN